MSKIEEFPVESDGEFPVDSDGDWEKIMVECVNEVSSDGHEKQHQMFIFISLYTIERLIESSSYRGT
jgi:hypothetical protein